MVALTSDQRLHGKLNTNLPKVPLFYNALRTALTVKNLGMNVIPLNRYEGV